MGDGAMPDLTADERLPERTLTLLSRTGPVADSALLPWGLTHVSSPVESQQCRDFCRGYVRSMSEGVRHSCDLRRHRLDSSMSVGVESRRG